MTTDNTILEETVASEIQPTATARQTPPGFRLYVPMAILLLMATAFVVTRLFYSGTIVQFFTSLIAPLVSLVGIAVWLIFFSKLSIRDRVALCVTFCIAIVAASQLLHLSMFPIGLVIYVLPVMMTLPVIWMAIIPGPFHSAKRIGTYVTMLAPILFFAGMRIDGISGSMDATVSYRWKPSAEDLYMASLASDSTVEPDNATDIITEIGGRPLVASVTDWTEFRGSQRDGTADHAMLAEDWVQQEFQELWRRPIGPGWSSFIVVSGRLFTQEQRGDQEAIVCMDTETGETIWADLTDDRFYEVVGNAGPRATPTFDNGRIYALGAKGKLTALDAASGRRLWQSDMIADTGAQVPTWGFSSSPLVVDGNKVIVIAGDPGTKVIAYDADNGQVLWKALEKGLSYSSPQLMEIDGQRQVVVMDGDGVFALDPDSGTPLWSHLWQITQAARIVQPLQIDSQSLLIGTGYGEGTRRLKVTKASSGWRVEEEWTSRNLKPYFNDFILHKNYLYGFDHEIIACIDASTGDRMWKKGRYGFGQMLLEPQSNVLIVLGEQGELAFLNASPDKTEAVELKKIQALEGKTWNHPVLVQNRLYLRNAQEAACYVLPQ